MTMTDLDTDIRDFVTSVQKVCESALTPDQWSPTVPSDDRNAKLRERLTEVGWFDVAAEPYGTDFLGAAAVELGRALSSIDVIDDLLGHGVALGAGAAGGVSLARYVEAGQRVWLCEANGATLGEVLDAEPVRYIDAQAVAIVTTEPVAESALLPGAGVDAWVAAMTGYLAGLTTGALELAGGYAQQRIAFGKPIAELDAVAKKIADCATAAEGLVMGAHAPPDAFVLQQAPVTAFKTMRACHQILGATGFTLEYPLQRYSRRVEALRAWTRPIVAALDASRGDE